MITLGHGIKLPTCASGTPRSELGAVICSPASRIHFCQNVRAESARITQPIARVPEVGFNSKLQSDTLGRNENPGDTIAAGSVQKRLASAFMPAHGTVGHEGVIQLSKGRRSLVRRFSGVAVASTGSFNIRRLEAYTEKVKSEVLLVHAEVDGEEDEVLVFKGFSSSLVRPTASDPSEPVLPTDAKVVRVDWIRAPFNPTKTVYIKEGITLDELEGLLQSKGL